VIVEYGVSLTTSIVDLLELDLRLRVMGVVQFEQLGKILTGEVPTRYPTSGKSELVSSRPSGMISDKHIYNI